MNQRWRDRRDLYRPAEPIDPSQYEVAPLADDATPAAFVRQHHYSASYPAARYRFGLYRGPQLAGVAVFSHPCNDATLTRVFPGQAVESVELGRFVLLDDVPGNGETWFLARAFEILRREGLRGVLSFSDPLPRTTAAGTVAFGGHIGTIYQAFNGVYLGRGAARTLRLLPDGTVLNDRTIQKIRRQERGWRAAVALLERYGAEPLGGAPNTVNLDMRAWLARALARVTRPVRHPGNHKYAWAFTRVDRKGLMGRPYPKLAAPERAHLQRCGRPDQLEH